METKLRHTIRHTLQPKKDTLFLGSIIAIFACLLFLAGYFWYTISLKAKAQQQLGNMTPDTIQSLPTVEPKGGWTSYKNPQYKFSVELPRFLTKAEYRDIDGYTFLAIFGETSISKGKGVAIGITMRDLNSEVAQTKVDYAKEGNAQLAEEKDIAVGGERGKELHFKPKDGAEGLEEKTYIIVHHGNYTYSISTVPEQVEHIVISFKFL